MEPINQVFWDSPVAAHLWGLRLGVLHSGALPFSGGCKCLWWRDHFCRLSHLCLDKRKLPGVPDHQGTCHITCWKSRVIGHENFQAVNFLILIKTAPGSKPNTSPTIRWCFARVKLARQLLRLISIHLLISHAYIFLWQDLYLWGEYERPSCLYKQRKGGGIQTVKDKKVMREGD